MAARGKGRYRAMRAGYPRRRPPGTARWLWRARWAVACLLLPPCRCCRLTCCLPLCNWIEATLPAIEVSPVQVAIRKPPRAAHDLHRALLRRPKRPRSVGAPGLCAARPKDGATPSPACLRAGGPPNGVVPVRPCGGRVGRGGVRWIGWVGCRHRRAPSDVHRLGPWPWPRPTLAWGAAPAAARTSLLHDSEPGVSQAALVQLRASGRPECVWHN